MFRAKKHRELRVGKNIGHQVMCSEKGNNMKLILIEEISTVRDRILLSTYENKMPINIYI